MLAIEKRITAPGPKRILALDGGGARGLVTLGFLEKIEELLAKRFNDANFHLHQYFDLIGGTSTGAVIATLLSLGWRPAEIRTLYLKMLPSVFRPRGSAWRRFLAEYGFETKFDTRRFSESIDEAFKDVAKRAGTKPSRLTFETNELKTALAVYAKRIDSGAVWVQTNNPRRKYWTPNSAVFWADNPQTFHPNRDYSLKTLVQASAAAPYFVDPVPLEIEEGQTGLFVDGGASPHNNPARDLFLISTLRATPEPGEAPAPTPHGFGWSTGEDQLMMISIGTGYVRPRIKPEAYLEMPEVKQAIHSLRSIIADAELDVVAWMQAMSRSHDPWSINSEVEDMRGLRVVDTPLLSFQRYNEVIEEEALAKLMGDAWAKQNLTERKLADMREFDVVTKTNLDRLTEIGLAAGAARVKPEHFPVAFDLPVAPGDAEA